VSHTFIATSGGEYLAGFNPIFAPTATTTAALRAFGSTMSFQGTAASPNGGMRGLDLAVLNDATVDFGSLIGAILLLWNRGANTTVTNAIGVDTDFRSTESTATITNGIGVRVLYNNTTGTITNKYAFITDIGLVGIGTTTPGGGTTAGTKVLSLADGTAPAGGVSGQVSLYSSAGELYALDSAGNATLLSPHRFELFEPDSSYELPFSYYSENRFVGKKINVDMYGAIRALEQLTGKQFIFTEDLPAEEIIDWDENEELQRIRQEKEIEAWQKRKAEYEKLPVEKRKEASPPEPPGEQPKPYAKRTPPKWMAGRLPKLEAK